MRACSAAEMRRIDEQALAAFGLPTLLLMENAGAAVARRAWERTGGRGRIVIACGKGNNGGDGLVAARHLQNRGGDVGCLLAGDADALNGDARLNYELALKVGVRIEPWGASAAPFAGAVLIVDALLGTGFTGELRGAVAETVRTIRASGIPVLAVDVPTGLDATTGKAAELTVNAFETVTFGAMKLGLASYPGRALAGEITVAAISLPLPLITELPSEWLTPDRIAPFWPAREIEAHKGRSGRMLLLAGSPGLTGAAALAAKSALRSGAGLVTVAAPERACRTLGCLLTEAMSLPLPETADGHAAPEALPQLTHSAAIAGALGIGPGLGRNPETGKLLRQLLAATPCPVVIDADGLTLLSPGEPGVFPPNSVLTPHPGEMARLLDSTIAEVQGDRIACAREAARKFGCVVLLKGPATVIAAPDGRLAVNSTGSPALATGGTGDVLTGIIAASLARGLSPYEAAISGVYVHGIAGEIAEERFGAPGAIAGDVIASLPEALSRLRAGEIAFPCRMI